MPQQSPRAFDVDRAQSRLGSRPLYYFPSLDSTMREAARLASSSCATGTTVITDEQTAGQGRHGHSWLSEDRSGLYVSIVMRLPLADEALPSLTLALGLATAEAIARATDMECDLRWPNDVMLRGRKVAGILANLADNAVVAGIGVNVNHATFPIELCGQATSLRIESGGEHSREELLVHLLQSVDSFCRMLMVGGREAIFELFARRSSYARGKRVTVDSGNGLLQGTTAGLDSCGFLIVERDDGARETIVAGGVRAAGD